MTGDEGAATVAATDFATAAAAGLAATVAAVGLAAAGLAAAAAAEVAGADSDEVEGCTLGDGCFCLGDIGGRLLDGGALVANAAAEAATAAAAVVGARTIAGAMAAVVFPADEGELIEPRIDDADGVATVPALSDWCKNEIYKGETGHEATHIPVRQAHC